MAPSTKSTDDTPSPQSQCYCQGFVNLPSDHGLMITLLHDGIPPLHTTYESGGAASLADNSSNGGTGAGIANKNNSSSSTCTCLKLHPQIDANLSQFHPNIYIPSVLLDYPDQLVKYGGGGSGVTVFGGYHPHLGSLVMKHGGYKDLIELVSLAKIERELGTRGRWKIDCITNTHHDVNGDNGKGNGGRMGDDKMSQTEHLVNGKQQQQTGSHKPSTTTIKHQGKSQPILDTFMGSFVRRMSKMNTFSFPSSMENLLSSYTNPITRKASSSVVIEEKDGNNNSSAAGDGGVRATSSSMMSSLLLDGFDNQQQATTTTIATAAATTITSSSIEDNNEQTTIQIKRIQYAMDDMKKRIPAFRMIYISPMHVRERKEELRNSTFRSSRGRLSIGESSNAATVKTTSDVAVDVAVVVDAGKRKKKSVVVRRDSSVLRKGRTLHLFGSPHTKASSIEIHDDHVDLCFGGSYRSYNLSEEDGGEYDVEEDMMSGGETNNTSSDSPQKQPQQPQHHSCRSRADGSDGYSSLMAFVDHLRDRQQANEWKVTLAQQTIGQNANTASSLLARGELHGPLLNHLIDSEIQIIKNLQLLTMPEEENVVDKVRAEYNDIIECQKTNKGCTVSAAQVSSLADDFVGKAIKKNFDPEKGRFIMLQQFSIDLRHGNIHLKPNEVIPAKHLENLFYATWANRGMSVEGQNECDKHNATSLIEETFNMYYNVDEGQGSTTPPNYNHPIFASGLDQWQSLLELSLSIKHPNATNRIWNCGLSDGGLHNMFLSDDNLWLFDLGEPSLQPIPAFLTKFLMSFFHTLGMEEDEKGDWVVRFEQDDSGKLRPTQQTLDILPKIMLAFNTAMDKIVEEIFGGEDDIRILLLRYVVTQLISDAAFCIEKWRMKGGGDKERSDHQYYLEKWLWRALWDVYSSEEIRRRYLSRSLLQRQPKSRHLGLGSGGGALNKTTRLTVFMSKNSS